MLRGRRLVLFHFLKELLDTLSAFFGVIECKVKIGQAPELQALDQLVANEPGSVLERFYGASLLFRIARAHRNKDACMLHVRLNADFADNDIAFEARIL